VHKSVAATLIMEASLKYTDENLHALQKTAQKPQKRAVRANCALVCRLASSDTQVAVPYQNAYLSLRDDYVLVKKPQLKS
jgi:hypothetical protein